MVPAITFPLLGENFVLNFLPYITVFGWKIYWYGIIIAVGFLLAVWYCTKRAPKFGLTEDNILDMLLWAVPLGIIGARLYYVIFYRDADGLNPYFDGVNDLADIVRIWNGGLAIYGGVIGGALGLLISTRRKKVSTRAMLDIAAFGLLIGQAVGRWGNFTNREAYGVETKVPWRMGLVREFSSGLVKTFYYHPTFLYESLWNALGFLILHFVSKKRRKYDGQMFLGYLAWYGLGRAVIEGLRTDALFVGNSNLRVSQLLAGLTCILSLGAMLFIRFFRHPEAEELWVNRDKKAAILETERLEREKKAAKAASERFDAELSDAFRILSGADPEGFTEAPVVEPVNFTEAIPSAGDLPAGLNIPGEDEPEAAEASANETNEKSAETEKDMENGTN